jgi:CHAD domain-containing protein
MVENMTELLFSESTGNSSPAVAEFVHKLIHQQFDRIVQKERGVLADKDPEHLHQMRVSSRRLSATLQIFGKAIELPKIARGKALGTLTKTLGKLRDLDVQVAVLWDDYYPQINSSEQKKLKKLLAKLGKQRTRAFTATEAALKHPRYQKLKNAYQTWLNNPQYTSIANLQLSFLSPELFSPFLSALLIHPAWLILMEDRSKKSSRILHDLRKICKTVRYQAEFLAPLYSLEFQTWIDELKQLQDALGKFQDVQVLRKLLSDELGENIILPELDRVIQNEQESALADWEALRNNYLDLDFRHRLYQMILEPCCLILS